MFNWFKKGSSSLATLEMPVEAPAVVATGGDMETKTVDTKAMETLVITVIRTIFDPEIPVNIYDLGIIYNVDVDPEANVTVRMTLTTPACPVAGSLPGEVETNIRDIPGVNSAKVELVRAQERPAGVPGA